MKTSLAQWQPAIQEKIGSLLAEFQKSNAQFQLDSTQLEYLSDLSQQGKQFRGSLLAEFYSLIDPNHNSTAVIELAAALELYGTGILIHDDIIDRSNTRRGLSTAHIKMQEVAKQQDLLDPKHFGLGAAICLADVLFFLADRVVAQLDFPAELRVQCAAINGEELALLGLAEIEDTRMASTSEPVSKEAIYQMYLGKTGRYTGRWPLQLASVLAGLEPVAVSSIATVGEKIGVLYQLRDDELGLFGDEAVMGKSTTSDIRDGKKTYYYWYLQQLPTDQLAQVADILGNQQASSTQVDVVKRVIEDSGIRAQVAQDISQLSDEVKNSISQLSIPSDAKHFLVQVLDFAITRNK